MRVSIFLIAFLLSAMCVYSVTARHEEPHEDCDDVVHRPVYYYPVDDDFDGIDGLYRPQINQDFNFLDTVSAASSVKYCSFVLVVATAFLM